MNLAFTLLLIGCRTEEKAITDTAAGTVQTDQDGDGFFSTEDCNDLDAQIYPGAEELCDGIDNNCDGQFDEDVTNTFYADSDADGYGNHPMAIKSPLVACTMLPSPSPSWPGMVGLGSRHPSCEKTDGWYSCHVLPLSSDQVGYSPPKFRIQPSFVIAK